MRIIQSANAFTTTSLRRELLNDLAELRDGKISGEEARARAYVAKQVIDTVKVEIVAAKLKLTALAPMDLLEAA